MFLITKLYSGPRGTWGSSGLGEPAARALGNLLGQQFPTVLKKLSKNPYRQAQLGNRGLIHDVTLMYIDVY